MMKAFSFLTILESLSKKLSILRTKMHSDDLRVDYESITSQLRVSRPFSRTSLTASRRASHFAAILTILFTVGVGSVWGETVLFSTDFSDSKWSGITDICNSKNAPDETHNGITFHSYNSSATPFKIDQSKGTMTWCGNNMGSKYWIAIPITGVNGSITITVGNGNNKTSFKYVIQEGTTISGSGGTGSNEGITVAAPCVFTKEGLNQKNYVVYLGRSGSSYTTIKSIRITTPTPCDGIYPSLTYSKTTLLVGEQLDPTFNPDGSTGAVTYESNNTAAVTVDANGKITAVGVGMATIKASVAAANGKCAGEATVNILVLGTTGQHTLTWNLNVVAGSSESNETTTDIGTASKQSSSIYLTDLTNLTGVGVNRTSSGKNDNTGKIETPAAYDESKYVSMTFKVADGYGFTPSSVSIKTVAVTTTKDLKFEISDANGSYSVTKSGLSTSATAEANTLDFSSCNVTFTGTVTVKIYVYGATDAYRLSTPLTIDGTVEEVETPVTTTITLSSQGGTGGTASVTATKGEAMPSITPPTRTGYNFQGYFTSNGGSGTKYYNADGTSAQDWDKDEATFTLIAYWAAKTTNVTLNTQGGTGGTESVTATYGSAMPTITPATLAGYALTGYFDAASGGTKYYNANGTSEKNWDKEAATTTLYAQWECTAPVFDIKIKDDNPVVFAGETITLTVVGSNIAANATYVWKKGGEVIEGQTKATLTINNCTATDAGNYVCEVTNGTCTATNNYTVKTYHIKGLTDNTWTTPFEFEKSGDKEGTFTVDLAANTTYEFKLNDGSVWYWNEGTMTHNNCTDWVIEQEGADTEGKVNTKITTTASGTYTFTLNYTDPSRPTLSVTYPQKKMVYFNPDMWNIDGTTEVYTVYSWQEGSNGSFVTMTSVEGCGNTNIYQAEIDALHNKLLFIRWNQAHTAWDNNRWNQSIDLDYQTNGQYKIDDFGNNSDLYWKDGAKKSWASHEKTFTPNYSVTFDANGRGTAPGAQCVAKNGKATTPTEPTETGYTFGGWYKEAGCTNAWDFANGVVTSDITLYAKWTVNSYQTTTTFTNVSMTGEELPNTLEYGSSLSRTFVANTGYRLPETITVTGATYTWDSSTGVLSITNVTGEVSVTITGIQNTYTITYNVNRPTQYDNEETETDFPAQTTIMVNAGSTITLPNPSIKIATITVYTAKWKDASDNEYSGGAEITPTGDMTLTAQWTPQSWKIGYYESFDGTNLGAEITGLTPNQYTYGVATEFCKNAEAIVQNANKTGYTWLGWWNKWSPDAQDPVTTATAGYSGEFSLFAKWEENTPVTPPTQGGEVVAMWPMVDGSSLTLVGSADHASVTPSNAVKAGTNISNLTEVVDASFTDYTGKMAKVTASGTIGESNAVTNDHYLKYTLTVASGYKFTPTGFSATVARFGTDNAYAQVVLKQGATTIKATDASKPSRSGKSTAKTVYSAEFEDASTYSAGTSIDLYIYLGGEMASGKYYGVLAVSITGTYESAACTTPTTAFANTEYTVGGSALDLSTLISSKQGSGAITYTVKNANGTGATIAGTSFTATSAGTATVTATQAANGDYCEKVMDATITVTATDEPEPDNCGISECGNATLTYTINASTSVTNTAANLISGTESSNTTALGISGTSVWSNITATDVGKAAAAANECFNPAPVMSSKIKMYKGSSYDTNTYLQFTFTVKSGYTFTPCDVQFIVQPVMTAANFRWVITNGTTEYGSGTANDVPVGQGNGATALLGLSSTSAMPAGTYYIRLYPYDNDDNSFRISNDVILKGTIEEVVCTTPDAPTAFAVGSITSNGATFTITDAANTNNYEIYHSTSNTAPTAETEATITTTEKTKAVTGLTATTTYYAWVRAVCNEEHKSSWVALTNNSFTTSAELTPGDCVTIFEASANTKETFEVTTGSIVSSNLSEGDGLNKDGYKFAVKPNSSNALKIAPKTGETFKVGDKLTFVVYTAKDEKSIGFKIGSTTYTETISKELYYFTHTLEQGDIQTSDGQTTITFNRNSADDRWVAVKIERCAQLPSCTTPVLSDLENKKVCPGEDVTWTANNTAALQDGETVAYQWTKNSTVLSNDATLTLNDITEAAGGTYVVTATVSADGKASATATKEVTLTVIPATATPTITASANTIFAGNSVTLTATCVSSGVTYQWYTCNADGSNERAIDGATNTTLALTPDEAGTYYYKVIVTGDGTHSCGPAEKVYELVVKTPSAGCYDMIIFDSSNDQTIPAVDATGTEANTGASWANVGTSTNSDPCTYTYNDKTYKKGWKFVSGSTSSDNRYIQFVIPEGYTGSLFLAAYSTSTNRTVFIDTKPTKTVNNTYASVHISATGTLGTASAVLNPGTYYVCATDGLHLVELSIEICSDVNCNDPQVTATVDNATICEGTENVTFTATNYADGAEFRWQKKNGNTWKDINGATSSDTYTISSVTTAHAGQYRVIAHNVCNRISEEVTLTVLTAPTFNTFATTASVMKGNALAISDVQATDATGYAWYKSTDNTFNAAEDTKVGTSKDLLLAAASIPEAADQTFYLFCVASNSCGSVTSNAITVTVTPFVEEECATAGNEGDHEFGFTNTGCDDDTYGDSKTPVWKTNSRKKYLTYTAPEGRYFATAKVTVAHTGGTKCGYAYSTDGGTTWVVKELDGLSTTLTAITIELSELSENVNAFRISRNLTAQDGEKGSDSETFYLAEACFTYENACTETTLTVGSYNNEYNITDGGEFTEPTFTLKAGENTLEGQTLTYTSSNPAIATVDEEGNVEFEGMTGTVTITVAFAGGKISETEYCACQGSYTITVDCNDEAPEIVAADDTKLDECNSSITLEAKMQGGTTSFTEGTFQWYRDGEAIEGATSASYTVVRAGTYTVSRTHTCTTMSSNSAVVTNENVEPKVERLTPFQYYHVDKTYSNQMKNRHLFAVTSYGTYEGKRYHLTATRNGDPLNLSSSTAFFTIPSSDNAVDTVMIDLNELSGKHKAGDEIVITCAPINSCHTASAITASITIHVIDQTPTLALICSGAEGEGTRETANLVVGGDFLTGYNKADLCQQTGAKTFDANTEWEFYTELKKKYIVIPVNGYAEFNKLNYEPFDILLLTDYPKASKSEAAATILDDMAALCDYRPLLSLKAHMVAKSPSKWAAKGFTTSPVVPAATSQYANIVCYAHPMFDNLDDVQKEGIYHDHDDFNQLVYQILKGPGHESSKGLQGFELKDADNFVTIGLIHYNAAAAVVEHDNHTHLEWTPAADDRQLVAIAERQANIEARMILFAINCGAQSIQTPMGRQVLLTCLDYLLKTDLIEVADCRLTFDNGEGNTNWDPSDYEGSGEKGDGLWSTAANWGPGYNVVPGRNNDVRIAAPCTVDAVKTKVLVGEEEQLADAYFPEVLSIHITKDGSLTIPANSSLTARSTILRADENGNVYPTNVEDISLGSDAGGNASLILNNERGDTKAGVAMYSTAKADEGYSAAESTWQYIGTPHSDVQNAVTNYYNSWLYQYDTGTQGWVVIPNGGPLVPFRGYCVTHPESPHTYWMTGTLTATTNQDISIPANTFVVVANSWTAPIQINELTDDDMEGLRENTIYFFNTGKDPDQEGQLNIENGRYAAGTYVSVPIHSAPYTGDSYIPSMQGFYVVGGNADGTLHLDYERHVRAKRENLPSGPMHAPARRVAADDEPQVAKFLFRGKRYDDRLIILERPDFTRGYDSGWDGEQWGGNAAAPMSYVVTETRWDAVSAIPEYEGTVIAFRAGEDSEYTIHFDYDGMEDALYLLDTDTQIYTRVLKGNSYTFTCADKAEHNRFILTRKAPQIATGTDHINTGENAKAVKFIKDDKIFIFVNGTLYDATGKMVIR